MNKKRSFKYYLPIIILTIFVWFLTANKNGPLPEQIGEVLASIVFSWLLILIVKFAIKLFVNSLPVNKD